MVDINSLTKPSLIIPTHLKALHCGHFCNSLSSKNHMSNSRNLATESCSEVIICELILMAITQSRLTIPRLHSECSLFTFNLPPPTVPALPIWPECTLGTSPRELIGAAPSDKVSNTAPSTKGPDRKGFSANVRAAGRSGTKWLRGWYGERVRVGCGWGRVGWGRGERREGWGRGEGAIGAPTGLRVKGFQLNQLVEVPGDYKEIFMRFFVREDQLRLTDERSPFYA